MGPLSPLLARRAAALSPFEDWAPWWMVKAGLVPIPNFGGGERKVARTVPPDIRTTSKGYEYTMSPAQPAWTQFLPTPGDAGGAGKAIISPVLARSVLKPMRGGPLSPQLQSAVRNTPGAQITDEGLQMHVRRGQKWEQEGEPSVRGGVFYLPSHSRWAANYAGSAKNPLYGGQNVFEGETLIQNPLAVYGGTGGGVPDRAFMHLRGSEARNRLRRQSSDLGFMSRNVDDVREFLEKHAPELADQASYIVRNSPSGNQLRHALQEAAIGSAARKEGFDSILGYSAGYGNPSRLSELFDLREMTYPHRLGGQIAAPEIWPQFQYRQHEFPFPYPRMGQR